jgi:hypothetical protein
MVFRRVERVPTKKQQRKAYQLNWKRENRKLLKEQFPEKYQEVREKEKAYVAQRIAEKPELRVRAVKYAQKYRAANLEKLREYDRSEYRRKLHQERYWGDPAKRAEKLADRREYYRINPHKRTEYHYKASLKRKAKLYSGFRPPPDVPICECCGITTEKRMVCDHCHTTSNFRGWICNACNLALGHVGDDPDHLRKLIAYLEREK